MLSPIRSASSRILTTRITGRQASINWMVMAQHPFEVSCIQDVDDHVGSLVQEDLAGDPLLFGDGVDRIHAGGVDHLQVAPLMFALPRDTSTEVPG